jgi:uncharacterized membrane protein YdbT with pleckstrin-like domain
LLASANYIKRPNVPPVASCQIRGAAANDSRFATFIALVVVVIAAAFGAAAIVLQIHFAWIVLIPLLVAGGLAVFIYLEAPITFVQWLWLRH